MDEDIVVPIAFFVTTIVMGLGIPLVRAMIRRWDRQSLPTPTSADTAARLERIEQAVEAMAIEVERVAEGQRFVTRLMTEGSPDRVALPQRGSGRDT